MKNNIQTSARGAFSSNTAYLEPYNGEFYIDWFVGDFAAAIRILSRTGDTMSVARQFWRANFTDPFLEEAFVQIWGDFTCCVDHAWTVPDILALDWLRERSVLVEECVEMTFYSRRCRSNFIAHTDF